MNSVSVKVRPGKVEGVYLCVRRLVCAFIHGVLFTSRCSPLIEGCIRCSC